MPVHISLFCLSPLSHSNLFLRFAISLLALHAIAFTPNPNSPLIFVLSFYMKPESQNFWVLNNRFCSFSFFSLRNRNSMMGSFAFAAFLFVIEFWQQVHGSTCDVYKGKWVYDASYPLYSSTNCPFILQEFNCQNNGRPDHLYRNYRWQPTSCNLPRYTFFSFLHFFLLLMTY